MQKIFLLTALFFLFQSDVFAQNGTAPLTVSNGLFGWQFRFNGKKLNMAEVSDLLASNEKATAYLKSARSNNTVASILGTIGGFLVGYQLGATAGGGEANWTVAGIGGGLIVGSIPLSIKAGKQARNAVEAYNEGVRSTSLHRAELSLGFTGNGLGLRLQF